MAVWIEVTTKCGNCAVCNMTGASLFRPMDSSVLGDVTEYFNVTKK